MGAVHGTQEGRVVQFRPDSDQTEHGKAAVVPLVLEIVGVPPHERESDVRQRDAGLAARYPEETKRKC